MAGTSEGGQGVQEAGGKAPQAAVAQAGFFLLFEELVEIDADMLQGVADLSVMPSERRLLPRCGPMRNSAER